ncbi:hypothetical protein EJ03DRAFT_322919 [Teratosphaeria nubilosa]|uniref:Uncharacterized protein n=1 Tax=Teratosphaeria nubilosa TaxID=161662 RepID=A0A6G1LN44_9PEZI|nr:hypothetical protein EJ03DRAFT_322919 [Teratosphaeria nubilosa]
MLPHASTPAEQGADGSFCKGRVCGPTDENVSIIMAKYHTPTFVVAIGMTYIAIAIAMQTIMSGC